MTDITMIAILSVGLSFFGVRGILKKGRAFKRKDLANAHFILSLGELGTGLIGLVYLVMIALQ